MQWLTSFLVWFFLSEAQAFEIPTSGLPEFAEYEDLVELAPGRFQFVPENRRHQVQEVFLENLEKPWSVDGTTFTSSIKEKTVGRALYSQARAKDKSTGLVSEIFPVAHTKQGLTSSGAGFLIWRTLKPKCNIRPGAKVQFELHYQEVMWRKLGSYEHRLHLHPGRLAKHLEVDVWIIEPQGLKFLHVPDTSDGHFDGVPVISKRDQKAHVSFKPTVAQQRKCSNCSETAVDGELVVVYDVNREENAGKLEVFNGYFVHFFAPENMDPIPKNILFVIDVSGSMWGVKMKQTVEAMKTILDDLRTDDQFSVVDFNHNVRTWRNDLVSATTTQVADAKKYIEKIQPNGGELKLSKIQKNVKQNIRDNISLFSLGIGFDVDYDFLKRLSNDNRGIAQRIYGNQDTSLQLKASTELVLETLAQMDDLEDFLSKDKHADPDFTRKLWAYLTINQLLAERSLAPTAAVKRKITKTILQMSLEHHIVTPLTAMVIENEDGNERMLADSPPQDHSCCSGALYYGSKVAPSSLPSWVHPSPTPRIPMPVKGASVLESTPPPHVMRVENDPHFIIYLPKSQKNICFNIDSEPGKILNLVSDPESGILVNGQLIGAKKPKNKKLSTYFGKLGFYFQHEDVKIEVSTETITLSQGTRTSFLSWSDTAQVINQRQQESCVLVTKCLSASLVPSI
ncbi:hypothetical protein QTO34_008087 [Cnephaeus nilssonii]|uniref:VWFA domain-containing protein n=1 Tax=Cnephaeus nilssonii TaxID=3371016 RepID=A0AA40I9K8_CNENI|nr:hypothetical protein QTO34_008087 [Eptesicus nilssonii]